MEIIKVTDLSEFKNLRTEWEELLSNSESETIFLTWDWVYCWWDAYSKKEDALFILKFYTEGELVAIAPFFCEMKSFLGTLKIKILRFIGDGSGDSEYQDIVIKRGNEQFVYDELGVFLKEDFNAWDVLILAEIPARSVFFQHLPKAFCGHFLNVSSSTCSFMDLPDTWEMYIDSLDAKFRKEIERKSRNLEKEEGFTVGKNSEIEQVNSFLNRFFELHGNRWSKKGESGAFSNEKRKKFYYKLIPLLLENDRVDLNEIEVKGDVVAAEVVLKYGKNLFVLQQGMEPDYAKWGIGKILRYFVLKEAIENNYKILDHLGGAQKHKLRWGSQVKRSFSVKVARGTMKGVAFIAWPLVKENTKSLIKGIVPQKMIDRVKKHV